MTAHATPTIDEELAVAHRKLTEALEDLGDMHLQAGLARLLGVSKQRVRDLMGKPGFPAPVKIGGQDHWSGLEVVTWRSRRRRVTAPAE